MNLQSIILLTSTLLVALAILVWMYRNHRRRKDKAQCSGCPLCQFCGR